MVALIKAVWKTQVQWHNFDVRKQDPDNDSILKLKQIHNIMLNYNSSSCTPSGGNSNMIISRGCQTIIDKHSFFLLRFGPHLVYARI